ncbi:MAG: hypothetical protein ACI9OJ_000394 [Myxococcota bacterium]|jgi:hypothetical protein
MTRFIGRTEAYQRAKAFSNVALSLGLVEPPRRTTRGLLSPMKREGTPVGFVRTRLGRHGRIVGRYRARLTTTGVRRLPRTGRRTSSPLGLGHQANDSEVTLPTPAGLVKAAYTRPHG